MIIVPNLLYTNSIRSSQAAQICMHNPIVSSLASYKEKGTANFVRFADSAFLKEFEVYLRVHA